MEKPWTILFFICFLSIYGAHPTGICIEKYFCRPSEIPSSRAHTFNLPNFIPARGKQATRAIGLYALLTKARRYTLGYSCRRGDPDNCRSKVDTFTARRRMTDSLKIFLGYFSFPCLLALLFPKHLSYPIGGFSRRFSNNNGIENRRGNN